MTMPTRISDELANEVKKEIAVSKRSLPSQLEYWANLGKAIDNQLTGEQVREVLSGNARINVESSFSADDIQRTVKLKNSSSPDKTSADVWYVGSKKHSKLIEKHDRQGRVELGTFRDGKFTPSEP